MRTKAQLLNQNEQAAPTESLWKRFITNPKITLKYKVSRHQNICRSIHHRKASKQAKCVAQSPGSGEAEVGGFQVPGQILTFSNSIPLWLPE